MKDTKTLVLTRMQTIWHYFSVPLLLFVAVIFNSPSGRYTYTGNAIEDFISNHPGSLFALPAITLFFILKRQLKLKTINISVDIDTFKIAIEQAAKELDWEIEEWGKDIVIAKSSIAKKTSGWRIIWGERITIIWCGDKILFNSICDPDKPRPSVISFMNKWNRKIFEQCLSQNAAKQTVLRQAN